MICKNCPDKQAIVALLFYKETVERGNIDGLPTVDLQIKSRPSADLCLDCFTELQKSHFPSFEKHKEPLSSATPLQVYRRMELALKCFREGTENMGLYEEAILEVMDKAWHKLTSEEQALLNAEGPQTWPEK